MSTLRDGPLTKLFLLLLCLVFALLGCATKADVKDVGKQAYQARVKADKALYEAHMAREIANALAKDGPKTSAVQRAEAAASRAEEAALRAEQAAGAAEASARRAEEMAERCAQVFQRMTAK